MRRAAAFLLLWTTVFAAGVGGQPPTDLRTILLLFDDFHLEFRDTARIRDLARQMVRALNRDVERWAVVSTGPSRISMMPTSDPAALDSAIRRVSGSGLGAQALVDARQQPNIAKELRYRADKAFSAAASAINTVVAAQASRPFTVLYFSNGYDADLVTEPTELIETAVRANAVVYPIDPRELVSVAATTGVSRADDLDATRGTLKTLAARTQGMTVFTIDDLDTVLSRISKREF